ncbi:MAG TPA: DinB family protein [Gemmatimonadales bacterium]
MTLAKWTDRRFAFDVPATIYPELIAQLAAAPARAAVLLERVPETAAAVRNGTAWSMLDHVGHLADLDDSLFIDRLKQFAAGEEVLRAADMTNAATETARHFERARVDVVDGFRRSSKAVAARLRALPADAFERGALHPRLKTSMRLVDMLHFHTEHDDHHLTRVDELAAGWLQRS